VSQWSFEALTMDASLYDYSIVIMTNDIMKLFLEVMQCSMSE